MLNNNYLFKIFFDILLYPQIQSQYPQCHQSDLIQIYHE